MRPLKIIFTLVLFSISSVTFSQGLKYRDGDIIFIKNTKVGASLIPNGKTKFNYLGVIFIENGAPIVYHATEPVTSNNIDDFIKLSEGGEFKVRRLYEQNLLNNDVISTMRSFAKAKLQMHYDSKLTLNNDELYNAEFVYKMYQQCLGIPLAKPKTLDSYKNNEASIEFLKDAYGDAILTEKMVVIGDIYNSEYVSPPETD